MELGDAELGRIHKWVWSGLEEGGIFQETGGPSVNVETATLNGDAVGGVDTYPTEIIVVRLYWENPLNLAGLNTISGRYIVTATEYRQTQDHGQKVLWNFVGLSLAKQVWESLSTREMVS